MLEILFVLIFAILANLSFYIGRNKNHILALAFLSNYFIGLLAGFLFEKHLYDNIQIQSWSFFVITFCIYIVLASPSIAKRWFI
jgi:hypothetical protein